MKIAIVGTRGYPYVYGGFETFVREFGERLVKKDVEVHVYCQRNLFANRPDTVNGIHLHYIPTVKGKSLNQIVHSFFSIVHATFSSADIILVLNLAAGPMGWIPKITGKKTMINVDGVEWQRPKWRGLGASYFRFAAKLATKFYDMIITDADAMRQIYLDEFRTDSTVIAYGAPPFKKIGVEYLNRFDITPGGYYLIVGRLIPDNKSDLVIEGFIRSGSEKILVVVGDVPYSDSYAESLKKLATDKIRFVGYVTDSNELMALYQNCFAYFHGHKYGGTNPAMLKAMSNNCAIIALNTVFNREMLKNGTFGVFFDENTESLAHLIQFIEADDTLIEHLRNTVAKGLTDKYQWDSVTESYRLAMVKLLTKPGK